MRSLQRPLDDQCHKLVSKYPLLFTSGCAKHLIALYEQSWLGWTMKNCLNWLKWKSATSFLRIRFPRWWHSSYPLFSKALKVILNTKTSSWDLMNTRWRIHSQNQNVIHCCFQPKPVVVLLLQTCIDRGVVRVNDEVEIVGPKKKKLKSSCYW